MPVVMSLTGGLPSWGIGSSVGTLDGRLIALDRRTGDVIWSVLDHRSDKTLHHYRRPTIGR